MIAIVRHSCVSSEFYLYGERWSLKRSVLVRLWNFCRWFAVIKIQLKSSKTDYIYLVCSAFSFCLQSYSRTRAKKGTSPLFVLALLSRTGYTSHFIFQRRQPASVSSFNTEEAATRVVIKSHRVGNPR